MSFKNYFFCGGIIFLLQSCTGNQTKNTDASLPPPNNDTTAQPNPYANSSVQIVVFSNDTTNDKNLGGYGYTILIDGKASIHQPNIPAITGNRGFATAEAANKAGTLAAYKIKNNLMPPSVTQQELDSIGALQ